jgi:large subunit ribosomal protein L13
VSKRAICSWQKSSLLVSLMLSFVFEGFAMDNKTNKTTLKKKEDVKRNWFIFDASGKTLGRFASEVSKVLRGKHRPDFTPYVDSGDGVIVINADKIKVTGSKRVTKIYRYYTGAMSGLREVPFNAMQEKNPSYIIEHAVWGMMPKSRLAKQQMKRLRICKGDQHEYEAQQPVNVTI